jgi:integrase
MASIRKHGEKWQARIQRRARSVAKSFHSRIDAEKWARQTEVEMDRDLYLQSREMDGTPLRSLVERYRAEVTPHKKGARQERLRLLRWAAHPLAQKAIKHVRSSDIAKHRDQRLRAGASNSTVRLELAVLSHLFSVARTEWGFDGLTNPVAQIRRPAPGKGRDRRLQPGELEQVLGHIEVQEMRSLVLLALETAMRLGELVSLRWHRMDAPRALLTLDDSKNGERRTVPLSTRALAILKAMPRRIDGSVFGLTSAQGTDLFRSAVIRARRSHEASCVQKRTPPSPTFLVDLHFHDLRHEATSRLFERGLNVMEVASITGHKTLQMLKRYTHLKAEALAARLG